MWIGIGIKRGRKQRMGSGSVQGKKPQVKMPRNSKLIKEKTVEGNNDVNLQYGLVIQGGVEIPML